MKTVKSVIPKMLGFFLVMLVITSLIYPAVITAAARAMFPDQATGSIIVGNDGKRYGSELLAQEFTGENYMWGRIMNVDTATFTGEDGEPLLYSWASNKSPAGEELEALVAERVERLRAANPEQGDEPIPVDLVTCSGSGLDPDISPAAAEYQVQRIADARGMRPEDVQAVIDRYTTGRTFGLFGEPRVNVLKVNLALDGKL
ncbi:potassium-transporting ATPase subunit KdpC [Clostridium sp. AF18-27]|uniref:potassium-transporting ATPase subunit KdpC n=1 Tax=Enterocloster lavalensis TaxID=460384 RepID=UPI000D1B0D8F|nr:potassium-transporting ATPase subunit KdpC [Enterocloster lavalensis]MBS5607366.1 potassium-transporting ATPase subunit KdpC [Enterocloster asparagiformis]PST34897.1 potassium-transporting ATPase subunit C [Enterocloster lavalensis]RHR50477.1 potassium-transporting ATPase subunit KdpC [Clostridium sp. AF18-27]